MVQAQCTAQGVPVGSRFTTNQQMSVVGGNPALKAETAATATIGVVVEPPQVKGLALTADYWHIDIDNAIETLGVQTIFANCYDRGIAGVLRPDPPRSDHPPDQPGRPVPAERHPHDHVRHRRRAVVRHPARRARPGPHRARGPVPAPLRPRHLATGDPRRRVLRPRRLPAVQGQPVEQLDPPERRVRRLHPALRRHATRSAPATTATPTTTSPWRRATSIATSSSTCSAATTSGPGIGRTTLQVGVNNVFDATPPVVYNAAAANSDATTYDFIGRMVYVAAVPAVLAQAIEDLRIARVATPVGAGDRRIAGARSVAKFRCQPVPVHLPCAGASMCPRVRDLARRRAARGFTMAHAAPASGPGRELSPQ